MPMYKSSQCFFPIIVSCVAWFALYQPIYGQAQYDQVRSGHPRASSAQRLHREAEASELAIENASRVAASSAQIKAVLVKDTGLLVELKRRVAKDATDSGQVVEDADLSDD